MIGSVVLGAVIEALTIKALGIGWDALRRQVNVGSVVYKQGNRFEILRGKLTRALRLQPQQSRLAAERDAQTQRLFTLYSNQEGKFSLGDAIRIAYVHQVWFIPGLEGRIDPFTLHATKGPDYKVEEALGVNGYYQAAKQYRVRQDPTKPEPYPGSVVRISGWNGSTNFVLSEANYLDQYVTIQKEIVDVPLNVITRGSSVELPPHLFRVTPRQLGMEHGRLLPFERSPLVNSIGHAATVITCDGYLILPKRNRQVHFQSGYEGCSLSGTLEFSDALFKDMMNEVIRQSAKKEAPEEILLKGNHIAGVQPLAFTRELERAGKPQFFSHIWSNRSLEHFAEEWKTSKYPQREYDSIRWIELFEAGALRNPQTAVNQMIERILALLNAESCIMLRNEIEVVPSEEMRANLFCLLVHLQVSGEKAFPAHWRCAL
jgi:8-oxo-dGTP pyrophosphatase MutT (NUDIX family)